MHVSCAGHRKAVSYVRYLNENELVSASTDSTLRLWNIEQHAMTRLFEGHLNEKNFVGLSADGEFIACGSELNEVRQRHAAPCLPCWICIGAFAGCAYSLCCA